MKKNTNVNKKLQNITQLKWAIQILKNNIYKVSAFYKYCFFIDCAYIYVTLIS